MEYSQYQKNIFEFAKVNDDNGCVIAVAGSGKTTTAVESMKHIPKTSEVLFTTFGREIADTLEKKCFGMMNVTVSNYNTFGWRLCLEKMNIKPQLDNMKTENILKYQIKIEKDKFYKYRNVIKNLVSMLKTMNCHTVEAAAMTLPYILERHDYELSEEMVPILFDVFKASIDNHQVFDFDDQKYMPLHLELDIPQFDFIIVDESQDTNNLETELILSASRNGRKMIIGDPDQSIYGFRGATPDAMDILEKKLNATRLPLYICYRCSKSVVNEAKIIVPHIESWEGSKQGSVSTIKLAECVKLVSINDFVLCRTVAPLVKFCFDRIKEGRSAYVKGRDIGNNIIKVIDSVPNSGYMGISDFDDAFKEWSIKKFEQLARLNREQQISTLEDQVDTINAIMENCDDVQDLKRRVESLFSDKGNGITCMTIHKSKGLEAENVFILRPDLLPHPKAKKPWQVDEERRLKYVAITRAMNNLYWVLKEVNER